MNRDDVSDNSRIAAGITKRGRKNCRRRLLQEIRDAGKNIPEHRGWTSILGVKASDKARQRRRKNGVIESLIARSISNISDGVAELCDGIFTSVLRRGRINGTLAR